LISVTQYSVTGLPIVNIGTLLSVAKRETQRTEFGTRIRDARERAGLTQVQAAAAIGISQSALAELEKTGQGSSYVTTMARVYGFDAHWLATGQGDPGLDVREPAARSGDVPTPSEWDHLHEYRDADEEAKKEADAILAKSAERMRRMGREAMARLGLPPASPGAGNGLPRAPRVGVKERKSGVFNLGKSASPSPSAAHKKAKP